MTVDPKIIAAMRRAVRPLLGITDEEMEALYQAAINPVDPDEEWREAWDAYLAADVPPGARAIIAGLRAAVPLSPPYKALQARLDEAVELLRQSAAQFKPWLGPQGRNPRLPRQAQGAAAMTPTDEQLAAGVEAAHSTHGSLGEQVTAIWQAMEAARPSLPNDVRGYWGPDVDGDYIVDALGPDLAFAVADEGKAKTIAAMRTRQAERERMLVEDAFLSGWCSARDAEHVTELAEADYHNAHRRCQGYLASLKGESDG